MAIPFMPKFVNIKNTERVYWISNEEFHFYLETRTSGAPYASTFFIKMLHIIKKKGSDLEAEYFGGVEFTENPPFKGILRDKSEVQSK